jgi:hypothetical protein
LYWLAMLYKLSPDAMVWKTGGGVAVKVGVGAGV